MHQTKGYVFTKHIFISLRHRERKSKKSFCLLVNFYRHPLQLGSISSGGYWPNKPQETKLTKENKALWLGLTQPLRPCRIPTSVSLPLIFANLIHTLFVFSFPLPPHHHLLCCKKKTISKSLLLLLLSLIISISFLVTCTSKTQSTCWVSAPLGALVIPYLPISQNPRIIAAPNAHLYSIQLGYTVEKMALVEILERPTVVKVFGELVKFITPIWIAVIVGVFVGWAWRPKWVTVVGRELLDSSSQKESSSSSSSSASSSSSSPPAPTTCGISIPSLSSLLPNCIPWAADDTVEDQALTLPPTTNTDSSCSQIEKEESCSVTDEDLRHICQLVEEKDGGPAWIHMMNKSTPTMGYQAWRRDPQTGPPQYRSRTVFEDASPETVRDFFWDDEFRAKWDDMLIHSSTLEECPTTGTMLVHWVRKFPFFCSDRDYMIGRRIWESGRSYYCVTKGVPSSAVPRRDKPRRVDLYYSSWCIRAVESKRGDGQLTSCEVILFHHEDMGIPWEIAKLGVRQGMWGAVKKIEPGLRLYQKERAAKAPLSRCAKMAQINTKVSADYLRSVENSTKDSMEVEISDSAEKPVGRNIPKALIVGGALVLACSLDRGLLTKAVIFGVARRFAKIGRRL